MILKLLMGVSPLFLLLSAAFFSPLLHDVYQLPKAAALAVVLLSFFPAAVFAAKKKAFNPAEAALFILCLYFSARLLFSENHPPLYYALVFFAPFSFFLFYRGSFRPAAVSGLLNILFFVSAGFGLYQFSYLHIARPYSFFGNPIFFAEFCGSVLPFLIYSLARGGRLRYLSAFNLALAPVVLIICSSRGALISSAISLAVMFMFVFKSKIRVLPGKKFTAALIAACLLLPLFIPGAAASFKSALNRFAALSSVSSPEIKNRMAMAGAALMIFQDAPLFGMGPGAIRQLHQLKQAQLLKENPAFDFVNTSYVHNDYLQLLTETGLVGLLLFLSFIFLTAHSFERASAFMKQEVFLFSVSALASVLFFVTEAFFNFPLFAFPSCVLFYSFCGMLASCSASPENKPRIFSFPAAAAALVLFLLPAVFLAKSKPAVFTANFYLKAAAYDGGQNTLRLEKAARLDPENFHVLYYNAQNALNSGDTKTAFTLFSKILILFPNSADILYDAGYTFALENNHKQALAYYEKALFFYPDFSAACRGMYKSLMNLNRETEALPYLERAVISDSKADPAYLENNNMLLMEATP